jgi:hypothetical protein
VAGERQFQVRTLRADDDRLWGLEIVCPLSLSPIVQKKVVGKGKAQLKRNMRRVLAGTQGGQRKEWAAIHSLLILGGYREFSEIH